MAFYIEPTPGNGQGFLQRTVNELRKQNIVAEICGYGYPPIFVRQGDKAKLETIAKTIDPHARVLEYHRTKYEDDASRTKPQPHEDDTSPLHSQKQNILFDFQRHSEPYQTVEIKIGQKTDKGYIVELKFNNMGGYGSGYLSVDILPWVATSSEKDDGERLWTHLFSTDSLRQGWATIRATRSRLRIYLNIIPPELQNIPWETLCYHDILEHAPHNLATSFETPFSRTPDLKPYGQAITARPVKMLVAIANPDDLNQYQLSPINVAQEKQLIQEACSDFDDLEVDYLENKVTLVELTDKLEKGGYQLLHLITHGKLGKRTSESGLYFCTDENRADLVLEDKLVESLQNIPHSLQFISLVGCESAKYSSTELFAGIASKLLTVAKIPAVLAMQDMVQVETARQFMAKFYSYLLGHGLLDLACNQARGDLKLADIPGSYVPILFSRLPQNQLFK